MAQVTSPSTAVGKTDPSRNALKRGIFTNALLDDEDPQDVEVIVDDLINRFDASDASGEICARRLVQTTLQIKRLNQAQLDFVEGYMQGESIRQEFCRQVGMTTLLGKDLPSWYFDSDVDARDQARFLNKTLNEVHLLKNNYSVDRMTRARVLFPNLWFYLMGEEGSAIQKVHSFGDRLGSLYKKATPCENLQALFDGIKSEHQFDLLWAQNENRYESIVRGLRSQALLDAMSNPNWARADSLLHRRWQDLLQTLVSLKHEKNRSVQQTLEVLESTRPKRKSKALAKDVLPKKDV
jgi:hypothetical protein